MMTPDQFKTFRREHGWSQKTISELLGYGLRQINGFENNEVEIPLSVELACCALALGLRGWPKE